MSHVALAISVSVPCLALIYALLAGAAAAPRDLVLVAAFGALMAAACAAALVRRDPSADCAVQRPSRRPARRNRSVCHR